MSGIDIHRFDGGGYKPVVDFEGWRVAMLNSDGEFLPENLTFAQRHPLTDEVFVLLEGSCVLLAFGDDAGALGPCEAVKLEKNTVYNVRQSVWHTHALMPHTRVLVVENRDTTNENSPIMTLDAQKRGEIMELCARVFS